MANNKLREWFAAAQRIFRCIWQTVIRNLHSIVLIPVAGGLSYFAWAELTPADGATGGAAATAAVTPAAVTPADGATGGAATVSGGTDTNLLIVLLVAAFIAFLFAMWGRDLVRRLQKVGTGGLEFGPAQESDIRLNILRAIEDSSTDENRVEISIRGNVEKTTTSAEESWRYEQDVNRYLHLQHSGVDIHTLEGADLHNYRQLILRLGKRTLRRQEFHKAADILKHAIFLKDMTYDELFTLGVAHWFLALGTRDPKNPQHETKPDAETRDTHYREARRFLQRAVRSPNSEAQAHWALGWVYDELGEYARAIEQNLLAAQMDSAGFHTWAYWCIAVSRLKSEEPRLAIEALRQIKSRDEYWYQIWEDDELEKLRDDPIYGPAFVKLCGRGQYEAIKAKLGRDDAQAPPVSE